MMKNLSGKVSKWSIVNLVGFNITWLGLVFFGNSFIPFAATLFICHLYFQAEKNELVLILLVATIGVLLDSTLEYNSIFVFPKTEYIPLWLITLWFCFAATIRHSLGFLAQSKILQLLVGGIAAPLSYLAGAKFSVVQLTLSTGLSYLILACIWGPLLVVIFLINERLCIEEKCYAE